VSQGRQWGPFHYLLKWTRILPVFRLAASGRLCHVCLGTVSGKLPAPAPDGKLKRISGRQATETGLAGCPVAVWTDCPAFWLHPVEVFTQQVLGSGMRPGGQTSRRTWQSIAGQKASDPADRSIPILIVSPSSWLALTYAMAGGSERPITYVLRSLSGFGSSPFLKTWGAQAGPRQASHGQTAGKAPEVEEKISAIDKGPGQTNCAGGAVVTNQDI